LGAILRSMNFESRQVKGPAITVPLKAEAPREPASAAEPESPRETAVASEATEPSVDEHAQEEIAAEAALLHEEPKQEPDAQAPPVVEEAQPLEAADAAGDIVPNSEEADVLAAEAAPVDDPSIEAAVSSDGAESQGETSPDGVEAAGQEQPITAEQASEVADTPPAEEPMIEVWRPVHHRRPDRNAGRRRDRPQAATGVEAANQSADGARPDRPARKPRIFEIRPRPPIAARQDKRPSPNGAPPDAEGRLASPEKRPTHDPKAGQTRRNAGAPPPRPKREQPIDPNSPFAKLAALKAQLEAKQRED
jgi:ATP-dependent RNA helicase SUPV3L1/SUV3